MDDLIAPVLIFLLVAGLGWLVGIIGFFRAGRALDEVAALRRQIQSLSATAPVARPVEQAVGVAPWAQPVETPVAAETVVPPPPAPPLPAPPPGRRRDIEELLTAKWGVWLGAAALLLAGVFLVRYASDQGLLGPPVRCLAMVLLAAALIAAAEWLQRRPVRKSDLIDYAPQALVAGGVAILFGAAYMAGPLYEMVPSLFGFVLLAAASMAGLLLSLRFGQLVAAVGIVGAFITPLLVQTDSPSLPGLFAYLFCVTAAALAVVRYAAWIWLGWATTIAGAIWVLLASFGAGGGDVWAAALFVPAAAVLNLALLPGAALEQPIGRRLAWVPVAALGLTGLILALAMPEFATRAGLLALAPITIAKAAREPRLDRLPWLAAGLFLLLILFWGLPAWQPTGETISVGGVVEGVLPGDWTPEVLRPLLSTAAGFAAVFALAGLWFERRAAHPLRWSTLTASVPVLALAILYVRVKQFQPDFLWAGGALALAIGLTGAAAQSVREDDRKRAGVHAAGAAAALALGFAMLLTGQWLTLAFALLLPALAWIEAAADLPALRQVAMAVAALALVRLLLNPQVLVYAEGERPVVNDLLPVYLVATVAFAATARMFRARADDLVVAVLELGSVAFGSALVILEIRHWSTGGEPGLAEFGFREAALQLSALSLLALLSLRLQARTGRPMLGWAWRIQGGLALFGAIGLIIGNPLFFEFTDVGHVMFANALLPAYLIPAAIAVLAIQRPELPQPMRPVLLVYALVAIFVWITLEVRHDFHPDAMAGWDTPIEDGELWAWSGAWMAYGLGLMAVGVVGGRKPLRLAALAIVALAGAKVFLIDMSGLVGLWRVLSFLGLGLTLIGLGAVYRRFVAKPSDAIDTA